MALAGGCDVTITDQRAVKALIGTVLLNPPQIFNALHVEPQHIGGLEGDVWGAMLDCAAQDSPINAIAIEQRIGNPKGVVSDVIRSAIGAVPHVGDIEQYADAVIDAHERRRALNLSAALEMGARNNERDIEDVKSEVASQLLQGGRVADVAMADDLADADFAQVEEWAANPVAPGEVRGMATGLKDLDELLDGLWPSLFILAGRTSMGKTGVALRIAVNVARERPVLYCTFEQSARYMWRRTICTNAGLPYKQVKRGLTPEQLDKYAAVAMQMRELEIGFYDGSTSGGKTLATVTAQMSRFKQKHGDVGLVVLDNLGHISTGEEKTYKELGSVTKAMLAISARLDCTVMALHQINRGTEGRQNKRPMLSDLRDSGYIEEDAVLVGLLYSDDYYNPATETPNIIDLAIAKNKEDGQLGVVHLFRNSLTGQISNARAVR